MATPYMALTLPTPSVSTGPGWASTLNAALTTIDSHTHVSGQGQQVPVAGLNINADLSLTTGVTNYNLIGARALRLVNLTATPTVATDINELVDSGGNLYWMNSSGQAVQITAGAALSATSLGGISGLPSGTASASFGSQTFTWRSATNTAATMDHGPVLIRDTALGAAAITIASPVGIGGAYTLTLPSSLPGATSLLSLSSGGVLAAVTYPILAASIANAQITTTQISATAGIVGTQLANNTVTRTQLASVGQQVSASCGFFSSTSGSFLDVTNLTVTITTSGRPVMLMLVPDGTANQYDVSNSSSSAIFTFNRGGSDIAQWFGGSNRALLHFDPVAAGTYTYKVRAFPNSVALGVKFAVLVAYEL